MMEKKRRFGNNEGYSLVELIIVMAIIIVLSGVAFATITIMHSAKAKEAATTFESELSELANKSKGQMCVVAGKQEPDYKYCIMIYKHSDGKYYIKKGYYIGGGADMTLSSSYMFVDAENAGSGKGICLSAYVYVKYKSLTDASENTVDGDGVYIVYNRQGTCISGAGDYGFYKKNGSFITNVTLNKNGSHQSD